MKTSVYIHPGKHFNFAFPFRIFLLMILLSCLYASPAPAQLSRFAQRSIPNGIEVDASGNVHLGHDAVYSKIIAKFSPGGRLLNQVAVGTFFSFGQDVRMARIPSTGGILGIFPNGDFVIMDPRTNRLSMLGNLKQLNIRTDRIYDVYTGRYSRIAVFKNKEKEKCREDRLDIRRISVRKRLTFNWSVFSEFNCNYPLYRFIVCCSPMVAKLFTVSAARSMISDNCSRSSAVHSPST